MTLILTSAGSYPRAGETPELQILRNTLTAVDRGEKSAADLADAQNAMTRRALEEQVRAGIEVLTDGQIRWHDPISHLPTRLDGVRAGELLPFFDTNTQFRQPILTGRPTKRNGSPAILAEEYRFARNALGSISTPGNRAGKLSVKPVLTGPYTLAKHSISNCDEMNSLAARVEAYAEVVEAEIRALGETGAEIVQIDEPAILQHPEDWDIFENALRNISRVRNPNPKTKKSIQVGLHVYFASPVELYEKLARLPVDVLGLDFTYDNKLTDTVATAGSPILLALGLVNGRTAQLEQPTQVARQIERMLPKISGGKAYLCTSCGLEYLPRDSAYAKLELLTKIRSAVTG
ncbi:MAG: hypothetical protein HY046_04455 [Acidobacteria bacterium]|nr:hypothetical protein [Acidobacteriota bacterium]